MTSDALSLGVVTAYPPSEGSLNEFGHHLVANFAANEDVSKVVVLCDDTDQGARSLPNGAISMPCWRFNAGRNALRILRAVRRSRPDAVVFNIQFATFGDRRIPGALGLLAPALVRLAGTPTMVVLHNLADNVDMRDAGFAGSRITAAIMSFAGKVLTRVLLAADLVAVTIPKYVEQLERDYSASNALLAPHGSFSVPQEPSFDIPEGPRTILAFGKWGTYKSVDALVAAYEELKTRGYNDIALTIAGTDSPNSKGYIASATERHADVAGLEFTGYVAEEDVAPLFLSSALVAFPYSSTTGSSGVLHQAGEYGRAVVLPRIGDLLEIIEEEGFRGEYFEADDASSLADAMAKVLDDESLRVELGRRNFAAAAGIPMADVIDWHLIHLRDLIARRKR